MQAEMLLAGAGAMRRPGGRLALVQTDTGVASRAPTPAGVPPAEACRGSSTSVKARGSVGQGVRAGESAMSQEATQKAIQEAIRSISQTRARAPNLDGLREQRSQIQLSDLSAKLAGVTDTVASLAATLCEISGEVARLEQGGGGILPTPVQLRPLPLGVAATPAAETAEARGAMAATAVAAATAEEGDWLDEDPGSRRRSTEEEADEAERLEAAFRSLDDDGDERLNGADEVALGLRRMGVMVAAAVIEHVFVKHDVEDDTDIDIHTFSQIYRTVADVESGHVSVHDLVKSQGAVKEPSTKKLEKEADLKKVSAMLGRSRVSVNKYILRNNPASSKKLACQLGRKSVGWCAACTKRTCCTTVISPESKFFKRWSMLVLFLIVYSSMVVPSRLAWDQTAGQAGVVQISDVCIEVTFVADIIFNTRLSYKDHNTMELEMDLEKIRKKYLRSWFCVDLVSAVPVECINLLWELVAYLGGVDGQSGHADGLRLLRILKLMRLAKLLRLKAIERMEQQYPTQVRFTRFTLIFFFTIHLMAWCVLLASRSSSSSSRSHSSSSSQLLLGHGAGGVP